MPPTKQDHILAEEVFRTICLQIGGGHLNYEKAAALIREYIDSESAKNTITELSLCEVPHLQLRSNTLYRFVVQPGCEACKSAAAVYPPSPRSLDSDLEAVKKIDNYVSGGRNPNVEPTCSTCIHRDPSKEHYGWGWCKIWGGASVSSTGGCDSHLKSHLPVF